MRSAGNFHPEWGYLAPAPSFLRTARVALVATAIGATAGAIVVVSLVAHPGARDDTTSIAAHALVTSAPIVTTPVVAAAPVDKAAPVMAQAPAPAQTARVSAAPQAPASEPATPKVAALVPTPPAADATPAPASPDAVAAPETAPAKKAEVKKRHTASYEAARRWQAANNAKKRWRESRGFAPFFRLFSFGGSSSYAN
jgi:hypothetical protein